MSKFYRLTEVVLTELIKQLTPTQTIIFLLLKAKNPFTDSYHKVQTTDIAKTINVSQRTVQRSIKRLRELRLIDYKVTEFEYRINSLNVEKTTEMSLSRQKCRSYDKNVTHTTQVSSSTTKMSLPQPETITIDEIQTPTDYKTIQTNKTCVEDTQHKLVKVEQEFLSASEEVVSSTIDSALVSCFSSERCYGSHLRHSPQQKVWEWLPEGQWNVEGKLDQSFHDWLARKWVSKYQDCNIYESRANVLSYFRNDPVKLPIQWQHYQEESMAKVHNIKERLDNDFIIPPQEQVDTINRMNAFAHQEVGSEKSSDEEIPVNPVALQKITEFLRGEK